MAATTKSDIAQAISIDHVSRLTSNINTLRQLISIGDFRPMAAGDTIKVYNTVADQLAAQVNENTLITPTKVSKSLAATLTLALKKYRKQVSAEAIQKAGRDVAINETDAKLIQSIQAGIKGDFFTAMATGTGTASGDTLQKCLANMWGELATYYDDMDATPVYFLNPMDVASYLGTANISTQTAFGFDYVENFLGLGTAIVSPKVGLGEPIATAKENIIGYYIPANGDVGSSFGLTTDESGLIGMKHTANDNEASIDTLIMAGVVFAPEYAAGVIKGSISSGQ